MASRARSLRLKLTLWFVLVFLAIQVTLLGALVLLRRDAIRASLDEALTSSAEQMVENLLAAEVAWTDEQLARLAPARTNFVLYAVRDGEGRVLASHRVSDPAALPFGAWEIVPAGPLSGVTSDVAPERAVELTGERAALRLITLPFRQYGRLFFLQAAVRDPAIERWLGPFFELVAIGVPVGLVAALGASWFIAGRAVVPIERLSRAAQEVSPRRLGERIRILTTDHEIARLEDELNSALARIETGYRSQDQFISNVSHELRTPIATLLAQAQVVKLGRPDPERVNAFVESAERELKRLGQLVESFLVLARADLEELTPMPEVPLHDLVLGCIQRCGVAAEKNGVHLVPRLLVPEGTGSDLPEPDVELDPVVLGDAELLQTMVDNLVHNAIRHSPRGGSVRIELNRASNGYSIAVRDEGPGIPEEHLESVFDRFVTVPSSSPRSDGTGLGLAIASGVVRLHQGRIYARNNAGPGCSFVVWLPASRD